jgi:hypothetical protein
VKLKGFFVLVLAAGAFAALWPAAGNAAGFRGVVVAKQHGTLLVASPAGLVRAIGGRAVLGARVAFSNGHATVVGRTSSARVRGIVVRRIGSTLFLSSNRHLLAVKAARVVSATAPAMPGTVVDAQLAIRNGGVEIEDENEVGAVNANAITVQATVAAVGAGTVTLNVQGQMLTVSLPGALTLPASLVGQTVTVQLRLANDDENDNDDNDDDHGGDRHGGDDHSGPGRGGDDD